MKKAFIAVLALSSFTAFAQDMMPENMNFRRALTFGKCELKFEKEVLIPRGAVTFSTENGDESLILALNPSNAVRHISPNLKVAFDSETGMFKNDAIKYMTYLNRNKYDIDDSSIETINRRAKGLFVLSCIYDTPVEILAKVEEAVKVTPPSCEAKEEKAAPTKKKKK